MSFLLGKCNFPFIKIFTRKEIQKSIQNISEGLELRILLNCQNKKQTGSQQHWCLLLH